jgi:alpha-tubulin suppressor-like RCC1 family protein
LAVNPEGLTTKYLVKYGTSEAYGKATTAATVANENGEQSETAALSGLEPCTTYHYQAEAENKVNEEERQPGLGGDKAFITNGCVATAVSSGGYHTCALLLAGGVDCWGFNVGWEEGDGAPQIRTVPTTVSGISGASAIGSSGDEGCANISGHIECWGYGEDGQLGDGTTEDSFTPVSVSGITNATQVAPGGGFACALLSTGHVDCWGRNNTGQLGDGTTTGSSTPVEVSGITNATMIGAADFRVCALLASGEVMCWGFTPGYGVVNTTPSVVTGVTHATAISTGGFEEWATEACAVVSGGHVDCWHNTGEHDTLTVTAVSGVENAVAVETGGGPRSGSELYGLSTCALLSSGHIECWGANFSGELGAHDRISGGGLVGVLNLVAWLMRQRSLSAIGC